MIEQMVAGVLDVFVVYVIFVTIFYLMCATTSFFVIIGHMRNRERAFLLPIHSEYMPKISILTPAYHEERVIVGLVESLLQLEYSNYEIIVINDGSIDRTLELLQTHFALELISQTPRIYRSKSYPNLRVLDQENGGKANALNAGIALADAEIFCVVDADSILQRDSLLAIVQPFLEDPSTIASGGAVRVANGCEIKNGFLVQTGMPQSFLAKLQVLEYIRSFHFGRIAWSQWNALMLISGAFSVFKKEAVLRVGGYETGTLGEDMELVVRLHRHYRSAQIPYRISFVPDPICWTQVPEDIKTLRNQRIRWQHGLGESLSANRRLLLCPQSGLVGFFACPFFLIIEFLGPIYELLATLAIMAGFYFGIVKSDFFWAFFLISIFSAISMSMAALILEELSFPIYKDSTKARLALFGVAVVENFGYRQLCMTWKLLGFWGWMLGVKRQWGSMRRVKII